jgi:thioesterase domain-containing protein
VRQVAHWLIDDACRTSLWDWLGRLRSKARLVRTRRRGALPANVDMRDQLGMWHLPEQYERYLRARHEALRRYVPQAYPGRTVIIRSRTGRLLAPPVTARDDRWRHLVTGPLEVHIVPGSHHNLLAQPFLAHVARIVDSSLVAADQAFAEGTGAHIAEA